MSEIVTRFGFEKADKAYKRGKYHVFPVCMPIVNQFIDAFMNNKTDNLTLHDLRSTYRCITLMNNDLDRIYKDCPNGAYKDTIKQDMDKHQPVMLAIRTIVDELIADR